MLSRDDRIKLIVQITDHFRGDPNRTRAQVDAVLDGLGFDISLDRIEDRINTGTDGQIVELAHVCRVELPATADKGVLNGSSTKFP